MVLEPYLVAQKLSRRFGAFQALQDASFSVHRGEILGLIGPNGSGKTTLFQCVAGTMPADAGAVVVDGAALEAEGRTHALYFMPDGIRPWPDQTVAWVLSFMAGLSGRTAQERDDVVQSLAIGHLAGSRMRELSKGEHKRALLAAALMSRAPLLMLDEPFDGLDLRQVRDVMSVLERARAEGRTLFLSIHQLAEASRICDRFVLLSGGRTVGEGTAAELRERAGLGDTAGSSLDEVFLALT